MSDRVVRCPDCGARFRVTAEQLMQRGGRLRCGDCRGVFDGFAALGDAPAAKPSDGAATANTESVAKPRDATPALRDPARDQRPAIAWRVGVALLAGALALQAAYAARSSLAQWHPAAKAALTAACDAIGCVMPEPVIADALKLEDAELIELPGWPGQVSLQATIRNAANAPQPFPPLELALRDATGVREVRRVLRPADYLGADATAGATLARGAEASINVRLEARGFKPTGYVLSLLRP